MVDEESEASTYLLFSVGAKGAESGVNFTQIISAKTRSD
jgi:hypothetical protein